MGGIHEVSLRALAAATRGPPDPPEVEYPTGPAGEEARGRIRNVEDGKALRNGAVLLAIVEEGDGDCTPQPGDLLLLHYTLRCDSEKAPVAMSTHNGPPLPFIFGRDSMLKGWSIALERARRGSVIMSQVMPSLGFARSDYTGPPPPEDMSRDAVLFTKLEVCELHPKSAVGIVEEDHSVIKLIHKEGDGWEAPRPPCEVRVILHGRYWPHGAIAAIECYGDGGEFSYAMGSGGMMPALEKTLATMLPGERATVHLTDPETIEPYETLPGLPRGALGAQVDVELLSFTQVRDVFGDGLCMKKRTKDGIGEFPVDCPLDDCRVTFHVIGRRIDAAEGEAGDVFIDTRSEGKPCVVSLGMGLIPLGMETSLRLMTKEEISHVTCGAKYAYDDGFNGERPAKIREGESVEWELELLDWTEKQDWDNMSLESVVAAAAKVREQGNVLFKQSNLIASRKKYETAVHHLRRALREAEDEDESMQASSSMALCLVNIAAISQKEGNNGAAIKACNDALSADASYTKAYYRRGNAHLARGEWKEAENDFLMMAEIDASLAGERDAAIQRLTRRREATERAERNQFKTIFSAEN